MDPLLETTPHALAEETVVFLCDGIAATTECVMREMFEELLTAFRCIPRPSAHATLCFLQAIANSCATGAGNREAAGPGVVSAVARLLLRTILPLGKHNATSGLERLPSEDEEMLVLAWLRAVRWLASGTTPNTSSQPNISTFLEVENGAVALREAMTVCRTLASVQELGCEAVAILGRVPELNSPLVSGGCIEAVVAGMDAHPSVVAVQTAGCWALLNLSTRKETRRWLMANGAHPRLLAAMDACMVSVDVQADACGALANLLHEEEVRPLMVSGGVVPRITAALRGHPLAPRMQASGCAALGNVAKDASNHGAVVGESGIACIFAAMDNHRMDDDVQLRACGALLNLYRSTETASSLTCAGAVGRVFAAMDVHISVSLMQEVGCSILANCGGYEMLGMDMVRRVYGAMHAHSASPHVALAACLALRRLATASPDVAGFIRGTNGLAYLCQAMETHSAVEGVQEHGCAALRNLSQTPEGREALAVVPGAALVSAAMTAFPNRPKLVQQACFVLANACALDCPIDAPTIIDRVCFAMDSHPECAETQQAACAAMFAVGRHQETADHIVDVGGLQRVFTAMSTHRHDASLQTTGCMVLFAMAVFNQAHPLGTVLSHLYAAIDTHPGCERVQTPAWGALAQLVVAGNEEAFVETGGLAMLQAAVMKLSHASESSSISMQASVTRLHGLLAHRFLNSQQ